MPALMDGGLDLDFHGFTRLFHAHGWLSDEEFGLCRRFYEHTRSLLPPPDLIVSLSVSEETISQRLATRSRINIASSEDTVLFNSFVTEWLDFDSRFKFVASGCFRGIGKLSQKHSGNSGKADRMNNLAQIKTALQHLRHFGELPDEVQQAIAQSATIATSMRDR